MTHICQGPDVIPGHIWGCGKPLPPDTGLHLLDSCVKVNCCDCQPRQLSRRKLPDHAP